MGTIEQPLYRDDKGWVRLDEVLGTIEPKTFYQNEMTGENNIEAARGAIFDLYMTVMADTLDFDDALLELV